MTTENSAPEISSDDLLDAYRTFATEEMRLDREIAALQRKIAELTEERLSAKESKEEAFTELMKRG